MALSVQDPGLGAFSPHFGQIWRRKRLTAPKEGAAEAQRGRTGTTMACSTGSKPFSTVIKAWCGTGTARPATRTEPRAPFPQPAAPAMAWATPTP
jgi:hypothetical protein